MFHFELDNSTKIKLLFNDVNDVFHVAGIHQIYKDSGLSHIKASEFIKDVRNGNVTLQSLKSLNANSYKDFLLRIRSFLCIDAILKNSEYLYYSQGLIPDTKIKVKYLLLKNTDNRKLHLGIDSLKRKPNNFFAKTLLVTEGTKYIDKATSQHKVNKIVIEIKETKEIEEVVDRKTAYIKAEEFLCTKAEQWFGDKTASLKYQDFRQYIKNQKPELIAKISKYDKYWSAKIATEATKNYLQEQARETFDLMK